MGNQRNLNYVHFHCGVVNPKVIKANQSTDSYVYLKEPTWTQSEDKKTAKKTGKMQVKEAFIDFIDFID